MQRLLLVLHDVSRTDATSPKKWEMDLNLTGIDWDLDKVCKEISSENLITNSARA